MLRVLEENAERWHAASSRPSPLLELLSRTPRILAGITASASQRLARPAVPCGPPAPRYRLYRARSSVILPSLFRDCTGSAGHQTVQSINTDLARSPVRLLRPLAAGGHGRAVALLHRKCTPQHEPRRRAVARENPPLGLRAPPAPCTPGLNALREFYTNDVLGRRHHAGAVPGTQRRL